MNECLLLRQRVSLRFLPMILTLFMIAGCAAPKVKMYSGDEVAPSKQAIIRVDPQNTRGRLRIGSVDGKMTVNYFAFLFNGGNFAGDVYVLPGKHIIGPHISDGPFVAVGRLWVVAEQGETYILKSLTKELRVSFWMENERTGEQVGGIVGSDDEPK